MKNKLSRGQIAGSCGQGPKGCLYPLHSLLACRQTMAVQCSAELCVCVQGCSRRVRLLLVEPSSGEKSTSIRTSDTSTRDRKSLSKERERKIDFCDERKTFAIDSDACDLVGPGDGSTRDVMGRDRQVLPEAEVSCWFL
jgi:hypothetical protein